jgi:hypothetical protein
MPTRRFAPRPSDGAPVPIEGTTLSGTNIQTKAGTPTDADIVGGAADGDTVIDTATSKIWVRIGGTWKATAALT